MSAELEHSPSAIIRDADCIVTDSMEALQAARSNGLAPQARVLSCSPALVLAKEAESLEAGISYRDIGQAYEAIRKLGHELYERAASHPELAPRALTIARLSVPFENVVYKALLLSRAELGTKTIVVEPDHAPPTLRTGWAELLGAARFFAGRVTVPAGGAAFLMPAEELPALSARLSFEPWQSIFYRSIVKVPPRVSRMAARKGAILIQAENSLIKEAGAHLALQGFRLIALKAYRSDAVLPRSVSEEAAKVLSTCLDRSLGSLGLPPWLFSSVQTVFRRRAEQVLADFECALDHWCSVLQTHSSSHPQAILSNYNVTASGEALYEASRELGLLHVCSQHGTAVEFSEQFTARPYNLETATTDIYFVFNEAAAEQMKRLPVTRSRVEVVGQPRDLASLARRKAGIGPQVDILYVSTQAFCGGTMPPSAGGISDLESASWEIELIDKVLAQLPHQVSYKPYRAIRYADESPVHVHARRVFKENFYDRRIDLRYMFSRAGVIVVSHAASTLNWCLMSGRPVVYVHSSRQSALYPHVEAAMRDGVIFIDADAADFHECLYRCLSRPIVEMEAEWESKAASRRALIDHYFGIADERAGRRMADIIIQEIKARTDQ